MTEGVVEAVEKTAARERLRDMGLVPIRVWPAAVGGDAKSIAPPAARGGGGRGMRKYVLPFLQALKTLLSAGIPIDRALEMVGGLYKGTPMGGVAASLLDDVRSGTSLSDAMRKVPGSPFNRFIVQMVNAGQATGRLEDALDQAYTFMERSRDFRSNLLGSLLYPAILLIASIVSVVLLVVFVVPRFAGVFAASGAMLPLPTRILLGVSDFLSNQGVYLLAGIGILCAAGRSALHRPDVRRGWERGMLSWPLVGGILTAIETSRVMRSLSSLLAGGVSILPAFVIAREVSGNMAIRDAMETARLRIQGGAKMARTLEETALFPPMAVQMIAVGEETGRLEAMLMSVANTYEEISRRSLKNLLVVLEPAVILGMGILVGFIVFSIFLAIFQLNEVAM
ncbi:MAG: type II secretion system F family protein [Candidatus Deferrimicrobium sp.]